MPLAFDSLSHGKIAFGFFNIETDLLLLNRYFFFASDFCSLLVEAAGALHEGEPKSILNGFVLEEERIGNLMGAIHGFEFRGFIGEVYRLYPFPSEPEDFKQNPEGFRTRSIIEPLVARYGTATEIPVWFLRDNNEIRIGDRRFETEQFQELIRYVWLGGYPRWRDGRRPDYVEAMRRALETADGFPFQGMAKKWGEETFPRWE